MLYTKNMNVEYSYLKSRMFYFLCFCYLNLFFGCKSDGISTEISNPFIIEIVGKEYQWYFKYAGIDNQFNTSDDVVLKDLIYLPKETKITFKITSEDNIYAFSIPQKRLMEMAIPDSEHLLDLSPQQKGEIKFEAGSFCGLDHKTLSGTFIVKSKKAFIKHFSKL